MFIAPSINENGAVSYVGRNTGAGGAIYVSKNLGVAPILINPALAGNPNRVVTGLSQINNTNQVLTKENDTSTSPQQQFLRRSDGNAINSSVIVTAANGTTGFNDFDDLWTGITLNNNNQAAWNARKGLNNQLVTGFRPTYPSMLSAPPNDGQTFRCPPILQIASPVAMLASYGLSLESSLHFDRRDRCNIDCSEIRVLRAEAHCRVLTCIE